MNTVHRGRMRGQASVEFALGAGVLVLLLLGMQVLEGYQDMQRHVVLASRHAAFLAAWRNPRQGESLANYLHALHFGHPDAARRPDADALSVRDPGAGTQGATDAAATMLLAPLRVVGGFLGTDFDLSAGGYRSTEVSLRVPPAAWLSLPRDGDELVFSHTTFLLEDAWNASGSEHVARRTTGLVPTSVLGGFQALWRAFAAPLAQVEPGLDQAQAQVIEPERVPEDRLGPVVRAAREEGPCR